MCFCKLNNKKLNSKKFDAYLNLNNILYKTDLKIL